MKKSFKKYEKAGLPGGPNELKRFTQGFIVSQRGQWDYPGLPTAVPTPTGRITMKGVEDDLVGIDNLGNMQYMTPGNEYQFEGDMVYEIPQAKKGGSKKPSKKYSRSLMAKNTLFTKNDLFKKSKSVKNKIFDPNSPYFAVGGEIVSFDFDDTLSTEPGLEMAQSMPNEKYIISARAEVTPDMIERARAAGISEDKIFATGSDKAKIAKIKELGINKHIDNKQSVVTKLGNIGQIFQEGGELLEASYGHSVGNLIRKQGGGITKLSPEEEKAFQKFYTTLPENLQVDDPTYDIRGYWDSEGRPEQFDYSQPKEDDGYYHAYSINANTGEYLKSPAHPTFQHAVDEDRKIGYRPITNVYGRNIATENPSIADSEQQSFLRNMVGAPSYIELELDDNQIEEYRKGGYIVEDISIPSLTRMDNGGNPIKQIQEKEKADELSRLIASGASGGLGGMANYIAKEISKSQNKPKPSSNGSPARATAKPKMLAAVEKLATAPKTKPGDVNLAVRDFVQDAKEIDKINYDIMTPTPVGGYGYGPQPFKGVAGLDDIRMGSDGKLIVPRRGVSLVYPEFGLIGPGGGAAGLVSNALKSGSKYAKNVIWPALNTALPLGEGITTATAGTITPWNIASLIFGSQSAANLADSDSESRKSLARAYNNPTTDNILDAVGNVGLDALGILGSPGVTNMFSSAAGRLGKLFTSSGEVAPNTEKLVKGLESVPAKARPTTEQFKSVINKNIAYIKSPEYKTLRMQNTGETSTQVDKAVNSYVKKLNKTKLTSNKSDAPGEYTSGNLFYNPSINVNPRSITPERYLTIFDHEIKHALSPIGKYSSYKNYPILEGTPAYKEPSLKEVFFGNSKSPAAVNQQYANYHSLPYEQQVRALRLRERMKTDLGISAETPLTENDVNNWMSNYKYSLPEELGDVDDLLKEIRAGSANTNATQQSKNMTDWMNKAWMVVPGAGVAGAAAYNVNDGANYKSGGLIKTNDNGIVSELTEKEIDKLVKQGYVVEDFSTPSLTKARTGMQMSGLDPAFQAKAQQVANNLGVSLDDLIGIMNHESGLNPGAVNPYTNATGLIQFMPNTAKGLGTSIDALKNMSAIEQLDYVEKFYKPAAGKAKDIGDLYMYTFLPAAVGKPDDFVLGASGSGIKVFGINQDALYNQNKVFDADKKGYYTVGDVKRRISQFSGRPLVGSSSQTIPGFKPSITRTPGEKTVLKTTIIKDMQNDDWQPRREEEQVDPRIEQLKAFTKIIEPSLQNINTIYSAAMQQKRFGGNTRMFQDGGMVMNLSDKEIDQYRKGGWIVEDID